MLRPIFAMEIYYESASEAHKSKQRQKARELRQSQWWKRQLNEGRCYYCDKIFSKPELSMDHKIPVARGGVSSKSNVVVSCKGCNTKKAHYTPVELADIDV